jgi:myo-inositol 2-dehydrogenase / D-chiro-inositol 1-dehydrogenase
MSDAIVRLGIIGCGRATTGLHLPALADVSGLRVVAVTDVDPAAAALAAGMTPGCAVAADAGALLRRDDVDAIAVCVPVSAHAEAACRVLEAGKHLFVEKPLALTVAECDAVIAAAERRGRVAAVGFNTRQHRFVDAARRAPAREVLGALECMRSVLTSSWQSLPPWRRERATGGGAILEMATHHFDLWAHLGGARIASVHAASRSGEWEDETAIVHARLANGVLATGLFSVRNTQRNTIELCGRRGAMTLDLYRFDGMETATTATIPGDPPSRLAALRTFASELPRGLAGMRRGGEWALTYRATWEAFRDAVRGQPTTLATLQDGRAATAVACAAIRSLETGATVVVDA